MVGPFFIALAALVLFILLNLILSLSDLMVDRGIGMTTLLRLILFRMPEMVILAIPMSTLFATFFGLGRLTHDREIIALEATGISLRRILLPLLIVAVLVGLADFAIYNWAVPASQRAYQQGLRELIFREGLPRIQPDTFFKGPNSQFFYIDRYDDRDGSLYGVIVYDLDGRLFPQAETAVTVITAEQGRWADASWELSDAHVYGYDEKGILVYSGTFERLQVAVERTGIDVLWRSRTPAEMGLGELREAISRRRQSGLGAADLVVEFHARMAIPMATLIFVLFGGSVSLLFAARSRAVGIVIGLLLVSLYQGVLWWTQTLGRRGVIAPSLAAWIPDLLFGVIGLILVSRLGRLTTRDLWARIRHFVPFAAIVLAIAVASLAEEPPVAIDCDDLFVSSDETRVEARGSVRIAYGETTLQADEAILTSEGEDEAWRLSATGSVALSVGDSFRFSGDGLSASLALSEGNLIAREAEAVRFSGESTFVNSVGETHTLLYRGEQGTIRLDAAGDVTQIDVRGGELTTCACCDRGLREQPYTIQAGHAILYPDRLLVAFDLTVRSLGAPVFWLPVYVRPLEETLESPLFPAIGQSSLRGWFFKWNVPFYLDDGNYGALLVDYYSRYAELGLGAIVRYAFASHVGNLRIYSLPASVGDSILEGSLEHSAALVEDWRVAGRLSFERRGAQEQLAYAFSLSGKDSGWSVVTTAERTETTDDETLRVVERLPEIALSRAGFAAGPLTLSPQLSVGWYREWRGEEKTGESLRFDGSLNVGLQSLEALGFTLTPSASLRMTGYEFDEGWSSRQALGVNASLLRPGMRLEYRFLRLIGRSPFNFDRLDDSSHLQWGFDARGGIALRVDGGVDLIGGTFDPLVIVVDRDSLSGTLTYSVAAGAFDDFTLRGSWQAPGMDVSWELPYRPALGLFEPMSLGIAAAGAAADLSFNGTIDVEAARLSEATVRATFRIDQVWGISLGGKYRPGLHAPLDPSVGIHRDVCGCLRIGLEARSRQTWVYVSVLAFPEAILRYAPVEGEVTFGE